MNSKSNISRGACLEPYNAGEKSCGRPTRQLQSVAPVPLTDEQPGAFAVPDSSLCSSGAATTRSHADALPAADLPAMAASCCVSTSLPAG